MIDVSTLFDPKNATVGSRPIDLPCETIELANALVGADHPVFLDSSSAVGRQGNFSILAWEPRLVFRSKGLDLALRIDGAWHSETGNVFKFLDRLLLACSCKLPLPDGLPFAGGAIGYFGYDLFRFVERYENLSAVDDLDLPDCVLAFYDSVLLFDHEHGQWHQAGTSMFRQPPDPQSLFDRRLSQVRTLLDRAKQKQTTTALSTKEPLFLESNFTKEQYLAGIRKAIEHIFAGDIYQINLSQRFHTRLHATPFRLFSTLRRINPSFYSAYLEYEGHTVISSSPELFLQSTGSDIETRPIKGTRPRGHTPEEDRRFREELSGSAKEAAELSMIVDLERNDLGRVCSYGTVTVCDHRYIEPLPTVFHTISTVRGKLVDGIGPVDVLRATFPGGSITGCPKIRAIEIIDQLEPTCRNVYTGSIGSIGFNGDMNLNIAIRTLIAKGQDVYFQVGGGIVADSDPESEYAETLDKAAAMKQALQRVATNDE